MNEFVTLVLSIIITALMAVIPSCIISFVVMMAANAMNRKLSERQEGVLIVITYIVSVILVLSLLEW